MLSNIKYQLHLNPSSEYNSSVKCLHERERATQAQLAAISPQPLALSYAAKHGTPALIKRSLDITTGRNNYMLTLTLTACVETTLKITLGEWFVCALQRIYTASERGIPVFNHIEILIGYIVVDSVL